MNSRGIQQLLGEYRAAFEVHDKAGFAGARNVRIANRAATRMRRIAFEIARLPESERRHFAGLLESESTSLQGWAAHHLLEIIGAGEFEREAIAVIERCAASESIDAPGERQWLRLWLQARGES